MAKAIRQRRAEDCRDAVGHRLQVQPDGRVVDQVATPVDLAGVPVQSVRRELVRDGPGHVAVGGRAVAVVVRPEAERPPLPGKRRVVFANPPVTVHVRDQFRVVQHMERRDQTLRDIAASLSVLVGVMRMDVRREKPVRVLGHPAASDEDLVPVQPLRRVAAIRRRGRNTVYLRLPAVPRMRIRMPVAVQPAHREPVGAALAHPERHVLQGIRRAHRDAPDARVARPKALYGHLPGRIVAVDVEGQLA